MATDDAAPPTALPEIDERRIALVGNGILLLMRASDDAPSEPLSDEDKDHLRLLAKGFIRIWDGLNVR